MWLYVIIAVIVLLGLRGVLRAWRWARFMADFSDVNSFDTRGFTPLHRAAALGEVEYVDMLIANGAVVDSQNPVLGGTPLHFAALSGNVSTVRALLAAGADPCMLDAVGRTARDVALAEGHLDVAECLSDPG
jgi:ankyrin repeat protein